MYKIPALRMWWNLAFAPLGVPCSIIRWLVRLMCISSGGMGSRWIWSPTMMKTQLGLFLQTLASWKHRIRSFSDNCEQVPKQDILLSYKQIFCFFFSLWLWGNCPAWWSTVRRHYVNVHYASTSRYFTSITDSF